MYNKDRQKLLELFKLEIDNVKVKYFNKLESYVMSDNTGFDIEDLQKFIGILLLDYVNEVQILINLYLVKKKKNTSMIDYYKLII